MFAPLTGVNYNEADRDAVLNSQSKITVTDSDGILSLGYKVTYDDSQEAEADKLGCSLMINGEEKIVFDVYFNPGNEHVDGLGTLWNATSNVDTAVLSNLTLA